MAYNQKPEYGSKPDLGHWSMRDSVLNLPVLGKLDLYDYSGKGNVATPDGVTAAVGDRGHALSFEAASDKVLLPTTVTNDPYKLTVAIRFRALSAGVIITRSRWSHPFIFEVNTTHFRFIARTEAGTTNIYTTANWGEWVDVALVVDMTKSTIELYVDGEIKASNSSVAGTALSYINTRNWSLGCSSDIDDSGFLGEIADVSILDGVALSAQQIKSLYENPWQAWQKDDTLLWAAQLGITPTQYYKLFLQGVA